MADKAAWESVERMLAFERTLADVSARIACATPQRVEDEIRHGLFALLGFLDVDRHTFFEVTEDGSLIALCSVAVPGVVPIPPGPFLDQAHWYREELRSGRVVCCPRLPDDLPPEAEAEARYARRIGLRANLTVPLHVGDRVRFGLAAGAFRHSRGWSDTVIARLTLVGEVFAQALARARSEDQLRAALAEVSALKERMEAENRLLRAEAGTPSGLDALTSHSPKFLKAVEDAAQVSGTRATVLLLGETGTGKGLMAEFIHGASPRRDRPMIKLNCAALPASLIEAELFGREKGAYTGALTRQSGRFELAHGSTIFLDEIGELPFALQPKLLRVLQEGEFERVGGTQTIKADVRVIAATNRPLADDVRAGRFREDLYYRLNVFPIRMPPLRERIDDIPMLVWAFLREFTQSIGTRVDRIDPATMRRLQAHQWPGNIRELRNVIERAVILCSDRVLDVALPDPPLGGLPADVPAAEASRGELEGLLRACGWRIRGEGGAAQRLGIKPTTLEWRLKKLGIHRPR